MKLFATSIVANNFFGRSNKTEIISIAEDSCSLPSSIFDLVKENNATSAPEIKAEHASSIISSITLVINEVFVTNKFENKIQEATFIIDNPLPSVTLNVDKQSGNFHIVAGAFRIEENCDKKLKQLHEQGFKARKIGANKYGLHQVVYSSYDTRAEAQRELYKIKRTHNPDAWLLAKKLN